MVDSGHQWASPLSMPRNRPACKPADALAPLPNLPPIIQNVQRTISALISH